MRDDHLRYEHIILLKFIIFNIIVELNKPWSSVLLVTSKSNSSVRKRCHGIIHNIRDV